MLNIPALLFSCAAWCSLWLILLAICVRHFPWAIAHDYPRDMQDCIAMSLISGVLAIVAFAVMRVAR